MLTTHYGKYEQVLSRIDRLKLAVDCYRPTVDELVEIDGHITWQARPVFFDYLFVSTRLPKTTIDLSLPALIDYTDQLPLSPVILGDWVANVTDEKLAEIKTNIEAMNTTNRLRGNSSDFAAAYMGRTILITSGALGGVFGEVIGFSGAGVVTVEVPFFEQSTRCQVRVSDVQLV